MRIKIPAWFKRRFKAFAADFADSMASSYFCRIGWYLASLPASEWSVWLASRALFAKDLWIELNFCHLRHLRLCHILMGFGGTGKSRIAMTRDNGSYSDAKISGRGSVLMLLGRMSRYELGYSVSGSAQTSIAVTDSKAAKKGALITGKSLVADQMNHLLCYRTSGTQWNADSSASVSLQHCLAGLRHRPGSECVGSLTHGCVSRWSMAQSCEHTAWKDPPAAGPWPL
ncbi:unnamed protein product [Cladocopium goreaui]|uniref:Uncharacterized protein n=2 Tax=Cladocopium goreaui TaxID=2562237 RepID=A0A9P1G2G8_9DINO|nr:unnamed protein product [Cladocopium goreaui]